MQENNPTLDSHGRQIWSVSKQMANNTMPEGTKYVFFDKRWDLEDGTEVVAKGYSGLRRGVITAVTDNGIVEINDLAGFVRDVLYRIVE